MERKSGGEKEGVGGHLHSISTSSSFLPQTSTTPSPPVPFFFSQIRLLRKNMNRQLPRVESYKRGIALVRTVAYDEGLLCFDEVSSILCFLSSSSFSQLCSLTTHQLFNFSPSSSRSDAKSGISQRMFQPVVWFGAWVGSCLREGKWS